MPQRRIHVTRPASETSVAESAELRKRFDAIRAELDVPGDFPPEVLAEARAVAASADLPERDETGVPFVTIDPPGSMDLDQAVRLETGVPSETIDPPGSMDLDQAVHLERDGHGYRVRYAIADVPAFVRPGGAVDAEARRRGQTIYAPDRRTPLHPTELSEGAASLLPGEVRPAFVWDIRAGADGEVVSAEVCRALVRSRERHDYEGVQRAVDDGSAGELLMLLRELGEKRIECERRRGGASLPLPEQEVAEDDQGHYRLSFRPPLASEDWNAQISLMTGMAAAAMMIEGGIGILRTMPEPEHNAMGRFRRAARGLGIDWAQDQPYGEFLRSLDRTDPRHLALIHEATSLFRGAGYTAFDGAAPEQATHAAVAAAYAHVTAPLRRLVDRFGLVVCDALSRGEDVPDWVREALPTLPGTMTASDRRTSAVERACADAVEAAVLEDKVGQAFPASVVDLNGKGEHRQATVQVLEPAVLARADGEAELGAEVTVRLVEAEIATSTVRFAIQG